MSMSAKTASTSDVIVDTIFEGPVKVPQCKFDDCVASRGNLHRQWLGSLHGRSQTAQAGGVPMPLTDVFAAYLCTQDRRFAFVCDGHKGGQGTKYLHF